ncbi:hypothetical protein FRB90_000896 [Tulasnella sp. 427]|nr:hypothetical protein FRB90_000896 [Tulasnella sp. 427]
MDQNLYVQHLYPPSHHLPQPQHQTYRDSYVFQPQPQPPQAYHVPPPHRPVQVVARELATFDHQHLFIDPHYQPDQHFATAAEEEGLTGWVPLEEQGGIQHQPTSVTPIAGNEALIGYSNLNQFQYPIKTATATTSTTTSFQPQAGRATTSSSSLASWNAIPEQQLQHLSDQLQIYEIAGEAVAYHHQYQSLQPLVASPLDLVSGYEPQLLTGAAAASAGTLISPQAYNPAANDSAFLECSAAYHQDQQQNVYSQGAFQDYADARVQQHQSHELGPRAQTGNTVSQGQMYSPTAPSESLYQADMYQQQSLSSSESMAMLNGAIPSQHQQYALPASSSPIAPSPSSYEAEAQYHHQQQAQTSLPVRSLQPAAAPTRTSSLAAWADVPPARSAHHESVHRHHQQAQYHQQQVEVEEVPVLEQAYAPQHVRSEVPIVKPRAVNAQVPIPSHPLPAPLRPTTTTVHLLPSSSSARPLDRLAIMPDLSPSAPQQQKQPSNRLSPSRTAAEFDVSARHIEAIKKSDHVRRAAELHVDVGNADLSSPASHKARVKARTQHRKQQSGPYPKDHPLKRSPSTFAEQDDHDTQGHDNQPHHLVPSSIPAEQKTTGHSAPNKLLQHQTIGFSNPGDEGKDLAAERRAADAAAAAVIFADKKPFSACAFCKQRKIACGQRVPHARDHELPEGPRTCNQCARRGFICSYPHESRRGIRKAKPVAKIIVHEDGTEETVYVKKGEEEVDEKSGKNRKKKGTGPIEWIIAVDAWLICPVTWATHLTALELKKAEADAAAAAAAAAAVAKAAEAAATFVARRISPPHHPSCAEDYASAIPRPSQLLRTAPVESV